ncbi:MAG: hypothetical protein IH899_12640 [Planctomycetes bacterium]|nr:hypothetical protein [Planctomycetota bacterium]
MSSNKSGELLSAYNDGETSPEEFAIVERLLETSAEARRELDEIGELSDLLHSLPRQTAPVELAPSVLSCAEQESLLPTLADSAESAESSSPQVSRLRLATGLLTVAAALLLVVFLVNKPVPDPSDSTQIVQQRNLEQADESAERSAAIATAKAAAADQSATGGKLVDAAGSPQTLSATESKADIRSFSKSALNASRLRDVQIGDVIPYFAVARNQVAVLEVTVIDVQKAVGITQLLLERNQIPQISEPTTTRITQGTLNTEQTLKPAVQTQKTTGGLFAVYIESSESQLAETMEQLRQEGILADLKLRPPVELSQVKLADSDSVAEANVRSQQKQEQAAGTLADAVTRGRLLQVKRIVLSAAFASPNAQPQAADKLSSKNKSIKDNKDAVPKRDDTLSRKSQLNLKTTTADKPGETGNAFQMLIHVLPRSLTEMSSDKPGEKQQQADEDDTGYAPIRVILVFQGQPPAEAPKPE